MPDRGAPRAPLSTETLPKAEATAQRQLTAWRISSACAADGESALALLRSKAQTGQAFSFALLDMQMPGMSGCELARHISADPALAGLKMLVLPPWAAFHPSMSLPPRG